MTSADPVFGVTAKKPMDFQIFINLVDLTRLSFFWFFFSDKLRDVHLYRTILQHFLRPEGYINHLLAKTICSYSGCEGQAFDTGFFIEMKINPVCVSEKMGLVGMVEGFFRRKTPLS